MCPSLCVRHYVSVFMCPSLCVRLYVSVIMCPSLTAGIIVRRCPYVPFWTFSCPVCNF